MHNYGNVVKCVVEKFFFRFLKSARKALRRQDHKITVIAKIIQYKVQLISQLYILILNLSIHLLITVEDESIDLKYTVELLIVH